MSCQPGSGVLLLLVLLTVAMETQALYFATCWGWGPSCSRHEVPQQVKPPVRAVAPPPAAPDQHRASLENPRHGHESRSSSPFSSLASSSSSSSSSLSSSSPSSLGGQRSPLYGALGVRGIPSIVTSGGWEPGFMGKRAYRRERGEVTLQDVRTLLRLLRGYARK